MEQRRPEEMVVADRTAQLNHDKKKKAIGIG